ncbi:hypothetical protein [Rhodanobacter sp. K2T2]|uniref:hypothetical protein n=1 Tax=Rhodanobacter sp. K2T2 TaxID=2723085 RepID=UPI0015CEA951|nr:hypothetical protein [Rhodanobacter sp. K2T2]
MLFCSAIYSAGLSGSYLFDDYPNIVDNHAVQPTSASLSSLVGAALSSSSSEFKRPLASLSFAANYLASGLAPYWMKLTNLVIHLLNGLLVFLLGRSLLRIAAAPRSRADDFASAAWTGHWNNRTGVVASLIATCWMILPINLTAVLYVVQRMESMANLFVLLGLIGYVTGRRLMLKASAGMSDKLGLIRKASVLNRNFILCFVSITVPTALGVLAKETAVMLPLYALLVEWAIFRFAAATAADATTFNNVFDRRVIGMFLLVLGIPLVIGMSWLLPGILKTENWATRDFTLGTRLLSEARIIVDYMIWTTLPTPHALSFYHDDFLISTGLFSPTSTIVSIVALTALFALMLRMRKKRPLVALGMAFFFGCHLLTGTILPLELIYEHRNYFASFGLLLAIVPLLAAPRLRTRLSAASEALGADVAAVDTTIKIGSMATVGDTGILEPIDALPIALPRYVLLAGLIVCWAGLTALTSHAWGQPLRLAEDLATRASMSPRAQYELGRTYIIYSHYDPASPFTKLAYGALEKAAVLPKSTILPEQALIFMNARMKLPLKNEWWDSLIDKLSSRTPGVQDESSLASLAQCAQEYHCDLPKTRMKNAFAAALSHPNPSARLLATYGDYAWNVLDDQALGARMTMAAVQASPSEPAYQITLVRMLAAENRSAEAKQALERLQSLNIGGRLDTSLTQLRTLQALQ